MLLLLVALTVPSGALAQERHFETITAFELAHMDNAGPSSCGDLIGPQLRPEDTVSAMSCADSIADYFANVRGENTGTIPANKIISRKMECAARLILNHSDDQETVADILAAEFDKSCGEPGIM